MRAHHTETLVTHKQGMDIAVHRDNETAFALAVVRNSGNDSEMRAMADLFSSSPTLLALLKEASSLMPLGTAKRAEWMRRAGDAIAKAEGR